MAFSTRGMLIFEEKAEGMCDFYHLAWNGKDFLVYLRWKGDDGVAAYRTKPRNRRRYEIFGIRYKCFLALQGFRTD